MTENKQKKNEVDNEMTKNETIDKQTMDQNQEQAQTQENTSLMKPEEKVPEIQESKYYDIDISYFCLSLLKDEPFFAALSRSISKVQNRTIPTCQVCVNPYSYFFELHYNPHFLLSLGEMDEHGNLLYDEKVLENMEKDLRSKNKPESEIKAAVEEERKKMEEAVLKRKKVEILGVLKHEFYHLIFEHITKRLPAEAKGNYRNSLTWNWATDLAINSFIPTEIPFYGLVPGRSYKDFETGKIDETFKNYPLLLSSEEYYSRLKADPNVQQQMDKMETEMKAMMEAMKNGQGQSGQGQGNPGGYKKGQKGTLDDHSQWVGEGAENEMNPTQRSMAKERLREMLQRAVNDINRGGKNWGSISEQIQKEIYSFINTHLDWKAVLRYFVKTSQKADKHSSIRKINKRFPYIHPGKQINRAAHVAISIDQSGSVSDEMLILFFSELNKLSDLASFTVVPFDDRVFEEKVYVWKKGENKRWERVLCGGTNFDAPTAYVNARNFDGHIILTDLCAPKPSNSKCQRMWLTTESCMKQPYFKTHERVIAIPDQEIFDLKHK